MLQYLEKSKHFFAFDSNYRNSLGKSKLGATCDAKIFKQTDIGLPAWFKMLFLAQSAEEVIAFSATFAPRQCFNKEADISSVH